MNSHPRTDDDWEQKCSSLAAELASARDVAKQLQLILFPPSSHHHHDVTREMLVKKILVSYENALFLLNQRHPNPIKSEYSPPPPSMNGSPRSEDSDRDCSPDVFMKDNVVNPTTTCSTSRKRKSSIPRWTHQVKVSPGMGLEGPLDDGFSWRKYGQKDILGAKYPRCTLRNVQGCLATKQVQRSDDDPSILEITYRGRHTCSSPPTVADNHHNLLLNFQTGLKVITVDDLELESAPSPPPPQQPYNYNMPASSFASFFPPAPAPASSTAGSFFPSPATSFVPPPTSSTIYNHMSLGPAASSSGNSTPTSIGLTDHDFPFGNNLDLFDSYPPTTYGFDNSGFFS
ncbi:Probable WRKY transcription factor 41 [Linum grandiflorum]